MPGDYEEQVLITSIKSGKHCPVCLVPLNEQEQLRPENPYPKRTPEQTIEQLQIQKKYDKNTPRLLLDMMVHNRPNFTDGHFAVNVYQLQMFDMLHQLMVKGLLNYLLDWLTECVGEGRTKLEVLWFKQIVHMEDFIWIRLPPCILQERYTATN